MRSGNRRCARSTAYLCDRLHNTEKFHPAKYPIRRAEAGAVSAGLRALSCKHSLRTLRTRRNDFKDAVDVSASRFTFACLRPEPPLCACAPVRCADLRNPHGSSRRRRARSRDGAPLQGDDAPLPDDVPPPDGALRLRDAASRLSWFCLLNGCGWCAVTPRQPFVANASTSVYRGLRRTSLVSPHPSKRSTS